VNDVGQAAAILSMLILWTATTKGTFTLFATKAVLRQIQIRLATPSLQKSTPRCQEKNAAMCVNNPDGSPARIDG
jgi:hypothetical protein